MHWILDAKKKKRGDSKRLVAVQENERNFATCLFKKNYHLDDILHCIPMGWALGLLMQTAIVAIEFKKRVKLLSLLCLKIAIIIVWSFTNIYHYK